MRNKTFKFEAEGDTIYIEATTKTDAVERFNQLIGEIPEEYLTVTEVDLKDIPKGEEVI